MEQSFTTPDPIHLNVEVDRGTVTLDATDAARDRGETLVSVQGRQADAVEVTQDDGVVSVTAPRPRVGFLSGTEQSVHVHVELPTGSVAVVRAGSAGTTVTGALATLAVKSGSGSLTVARLAGQGLVQTGSGDVAIDVVAGELQVTSGSGDVSLGLVEAATTVSTGSGDIRVETLEADLSVKTGSGDLDVVRSRADVAMTTGSGDTRLRTVHRGRVGVRGASGDVHLSIPRGVPVWTDVTTASGGIRSSLSPVGEPADGQDHVELRMKTSSGDIVLTEL
ncbi:DUF4097 family beta strand repeat-containing protein [Nocardioides campestrisoli]|uniref:DUF4097 family beta strand repeat-containing protein n=1 Tax=Nocardioides campestrisoli TaxID=2736757 RepID=UPI0015E7757D|nr:DUF4097 family beta strand repeat-containing protein [Nocardioides campestrisoli]